MPLLKPCFDLPLSARWSLTEHAALTRHLRAGLVRPHQGVACVPIHKFRADVCWRSFWEQETVCPGNKRLKRCMWVGPSLIISSNKRWSWKDFFSFCALLFGTKIKWS